MEQWNFIDTQLCRLVNQLRATGYLHTLEAELRLTGPEVDFGEHDFTKFLSEFRQMGIVTVIDVVHGGQVMHSSAIGTNPTEQVEEL